MSANSAMKEIALFFTGGTILMAPRAGDRGVVPAGEVDRFFSDLAPHIHGVSLKPIQWSDRPSPHMTPELMYRLAKDVDQQLADPTVIGAVITHGTDVLVESAYMADLVIASPKPVIYTGSMRYYSETGYDGIRNLLNSVKACLLPMPSGVGVSLLMTDRLFAARDVAKINSLNIDAFESPDSGPVGYVAGDEVIMTHRARICTENNRPRIVTDTVDTNVPLVACYTGMDATLLDFLHQQGISGLVLEGFGAGNVPPGALPAIERLLKDRIPVVLVTRCPEGGVWPVYAYPGGGADLKQKGVILAGRLSGPKARLQLMAALGAGYGPEAIRNSFETV